MQFRNGTEELTINSLSSTRRHALLDSGAQLHAIKHPGQKGSLPGPGIHTASGARFQHDGERLVTFRLPEGRTNRVLSKNPIFSLGCLAQTEYWSDLRADTGTLFFLDKGLTQHSQTRLHKEESLFFVKRDADGALGDSWCERRCRSRVTDADGAAYVGRCGGTDSSPSCNTQRSRHS